MVPKLDAGLLLLSFFSPGHGECPIGEKTGHQKVSLSSSVKGTVEDPIDIAGHPARVGDTVGPAKKVGNFTIYPLHDSGALGKQQQCTVQTDLCDEHTSRSPTI